MDLYHLSLEEKILNIVAMGGDFGVLMGELLALSR
jgi:hypothetical protein